MAIPLYLEDFAATKSFSSKMKNEKREFCFNPLIGTK